MKRLLLLVIIGLSIAIGYSFANNQPASQLQLSREVSEKRFILRFAVVADSHDDNELLAKALKQAEGRGINFVIGLGDFTSVGTREELQKAKEVFDGSKLTYFVTSGDHDLWDSRNRGEEALTNFQAVFGKANHQIERDGVQIVILNNSDIYKGIDDNSWELLLKSLETKPKLRLVMAHKTPFHPESKHVMGENSDVVAAQAKELLALLDDKDVDGFFAGDLHFFAQFKSPKDAVKITTIGAVTDDRNFQGPRFAIVSVYSDYSFDVQDVEIR